MATDEQLLAYLKQVTADLHQTKRRLREVEGADSEPVAIIGMSCRYPGGVTTPEALWRLVADGTDAITRFPADRGWDPDTGGDYAHLGGFLTGACDFDPAFFGMSPKEALVTDPQQRIVLETAWEAFERAGIDPRSVHGEPVGVFIGSGMQDYSALIDLAPEAAEAYLGTAAVSAVISGRVSYVFGLEGPCLTVDTACSSSLVALHLAVRALRAGECSLALAGGVMVMATPGPFIAMNRQGGLSGDGRCKSFAAGADGTAWGEGAGLLLVERLSDAQRLGHPVLAVVRGTAVNQDGASNGLTAPNGPSQERVIRAALAGTRLAASDVDLVEAHGTGTVLGDPIEAQALLATYGQDRPTPLYLGSIKSNIGHTQAAAGVAGIIKMVEAMRHGVMPKSLHIDEPSPHVDWSAGDVELLSEAREWPEAGRPRRAAVSSFGISGTNAHVILEQPESASGDSGSGEAGVVPWIVSARSEDAVREQASRIAERLRDSEVGIVDVAATLAGRSVFDYRLVVAASDVESGSVALESATVVRAGSGRVGVVFTGQGAQRLGMGQELYARFPVFAAALDEVLDPAVREVMWGTDAEALSRTGMAQPALFAIEVALFRLLESFGIATTVLAGHSIGEVAAAHVAGVLSLADARTLVSARASLMQQLPSGGAMLAVNASEQQVAHLLSDELAIAAVNAPGQVVLSGTAAAIERAAELLTGTGAAPDQAGAVPGGPVRVRRLSVSHAFHSPLMDPMLPAFAEAIAGLSFAEPTTPIISTVTGGQADLTDPAYWVDQVRNPVRFADAVTALAQQVDIVLEVGPDSVLTILGADTTDAATFLPLLRRDRDESETVLSTLATAHAHGVPVTWPDVPAGRIVDLPTYPFQRQRYWLDVRAAAAADVVAAGLEAAGHPLLGAVLASPDSERVVLTGRLSVRDTAWLADHVIGDSIVFPGTGFVELAIRAGDEVGCRVLDELTIAAPLVLPAEGGTAVQVVVGAPDAARRRTLQVFSRAEAADAAGEAEWLLNAEGVLSSAAPAPATALAEWPPSGATPLDLEGGYEILAEAGYAYGPTFRGLTAAWRSSDQVFAEVELPSQSHDDAERYGLHPALLDACLHAMNPGGLTGSGAVLPFAWSGVSLHATGAARVRVRLSRLDDDVVSLAITDTAGTPVATVASLTLRPIAVDRLGAAQRTPVYRVEWSEVAVPHEVTRDVAIYEVPSAAPETPTPVRVRAALSGTLTAVQDWLADGPEDAVLAVMTRGAVSLDESDAIDMAHASVVGFMRAAVAENPGRLVLVDVDVAPDDSGLRALATQAVASGESEAAVRGGVLWAPRLVRASSPSSSSAAEASSLVLDPSGTVLVTGGTSGLGAVAARHLVTSYGVRHLVLAGRRGTSAPGVEELVAELAELGAVADVVACDVSDRDAVAALVSSIPEGHPLVGVVHAAGVLDDGLVAAMTPERFDGVLAPKADAAWHLHELTADLGLGMFVLFSSAAATLGAPGQSNYAAANAFLDALAHRRRAEGRAATAMAWGLWSETGMGTRLAEAYVQRLARLGLPPITTDTGLGLFDAALHGESAHVALFDLDATALRAQITLGEAPSMLRGLARARQVRQQAGDTALLSRLAVLYGDAQLAAVLEEVRIRAAATLGYASLAGVDADSAFRDLGFDSLSAVEFRNGLAGALGLRLPATLVFDYPSPRELAEYVVGQLSGVVRGVAVPVVRAGLSDEPVAIVGVGCRFPGGVASAAGLWDLVASGRDAIGLFPGNRGWDPASVFDPEPGAAGKSYTRHGGFLYDADRFDPGFFGISPNEALVMDPQQRLLLETAWEAFESAGIDPRSLRGSDTGVFAGMMYHDYAANSSTGAVASGRVSYVFGLQGPSMTVDTACSSSLVALHLAVQALRAGECSLALAGGVAVMATPEVFVEFSRQRGLAPDGRCKSFAAGADGTAWGEGAGLLLVERLSDARRLGHPVLAVVRGSAVNQDGASNGLTAPNGPAQEKVIRAALASAGLSTADVDLVEAHGTGTVLGDPIEAQALLATYGQDRSTPVFLGSIKSNIGHTQAAAGAAGVIKLIEAMRHGVMPKSLHIDEPSPHVDWSAGDVELLAEARQWPETGRPRRAAISSFGISGTNAHVILEQPEPTADDSVPSEVGVVPWVVSARSVEAVREQASRIVAQVRESGTGVADVAATLAHRAVFDHRLVVSATDVAQACAALESAEVVRAGGGRVGVVFTGQGAQRLGMGRELYARFPVFAAALDEVLDPAVREVMWGDDAEALSQTGMAQPALFAIEVALFRLLESFGIAPAVLAGHSIGEVAAAHVAGVLSLADARTLVSARASLMQQLPSGGAMLAVNGSEEQVAHLLSDDLAIAAVNAPGQVVLSGTATSIDHAAEALFGTVRTRRLPVSHAFHSPLMDPMLPAFAEAIAGLSFAEPTTPIISTVTGGRADLTDPTYWVDQVRNPVRFADAVSALADQVDVILEVGPDSVLTILGADTTDAATFLPLLRRDRDESETVLSTLATAHAHGVPVTWPDVPTGRIIDLPAYPFQRQRYWLDSLEYWSEAWSGAAVGHGDVTSAGLEAAGHPLLGAVVASPDSDRVVLTGRLAVRDTAWLADHVIGGTVVFPGTGFVELAVQAGDHVGCELVEELTLTAPLVLSESGGVSVQAIVGTADENGRRSLGIYSRLDDAEWTLHAEGVLSPDDSALDDGLLEWPPTGASDIDLDGAYERLAEAGYGYGLAFRGLRAAWRRGSELFTEVELPETAAAEAADYGIHPALLDAALHALIVAAEDRTDGTAVLPFAWSGVRLFASGASALRVRLVQSGSEETAIHVADQTGRPVLRVGSLLSRSVDVDQLGRAGTRGVTPYRVAWVPADSASLRTAAEVAQLTEVADLAELHASLDAGTEIPEVVLWRRDAADHPDALDTLGELAELHAATHQVLESLQRWLSDERLAESRLVIVIGEGLSSSAIRGMVRAAQTESPGVFVLAETDGSAASAAELARAVAGEEPEFTIRDGQVFVPRLAVADESREDAAPIPDGTVLITGGTGGLGAVVARHLVVSHGVRRLLLTSRRGLAAPGVGDLVSELSGLGAVVDVAACDVSSREAVAALLSSISDEHPLVGVVHAAGVLDDGVLAAQTPERFDTVLGPKADAAWHLHELTADLHLSMFVLFSSVAATLGAPAQSNYAAANGFLDALAARRRAEGLAATSMAWGLWSGAGMGGHLTDADVARMERLGLPPLPVEDGLALFDAGLATDEAHLALFRVDTAALRALEETPVLLSGLVRRRGVSRGSVGASGWVRRLAGLDAAGRLAAVLELVCAQAASTLGHASVSAVDADAVFRDLGFDSLSAVEFRNGLAGALGLRLPATLVFDYPSPRMLAEYVVGQLSGATRGSAGVTVARPVLDEPVAIVGVGCRFPGGVASAAGLWELVASGRDAIGVFPGNRGWDPAGVFDPEPGAAGKSYTQHGGFLYDADRFDPAFFGISPNEALVMDPQQRLLLETAWEAFESAGIDPKSLRGSDTGVFAGMMYHDYAANSSTGAVASGRLSYVFGLQGPCLTVDTACSSSLVALHLAVQALRAGECSLALAGGVAVMATPEVFVEFSRQRGLAPDGRCKSFAAGADGTAWGEGAGLLLVERLSDARRLGHPVLAVVRGSAVNQDGASNGLTAPNGPAQEKVIRAALASAGLSTADVDLVEAHGTGTVLGDPIEAQALLATYGQDRSTPVFLGSIKSNIGHTQAAAGAAGVIKLIEAMRHGVMPKSLHIDEPSPHVDWSAGDVELLAEARQWPETGRPRRAAISSFGISGTNAHVILEQPEAQVAAVSAGSAPAGDSMSEAGGAVPWVVSARSVEAVREQASRIAAQVRESGAGVVDVAATLAHRAVFDHRLVVPATDVAQACAALESAEVVRVGAGRVGVVFTGQGAQRLGMGRELAARFPVFAAALEEVLDPAVRAVMWGEDSVALSQTGMAQPALFAIEVALFRLLESFGIAPAAMAGHSIGEVAAAHVAGVLSLADARTLVSARASLMQQLPAGGAMLAVNATEQQVAHLLSDDLAIAAVNAPGQVVLSGTAAAIERAAELLTGTGAAPDQAGAVPGGPVRVRRLSVSHAFHSPLMDPMLPAFAEAIAGLSFADPAVPIISTVTGGQADLTDPAYWVDQVRNPVRFADAVTALAQQVDIVLEVGPDSVLTILGADTTDAATFLPLLRRDRDESETLLTTLATAHAHGADITWPNLPAGRVVDLPTYPFQRQRYWLDALEYWSEAWSGAAVGHGDVTSAGLEAAGHPLLGALVPLAGSEAVVFTGRLAPSAQEWLADHEIFGHVLLPGTALVELAMRAGDHVGYDRLDELTIIAPLVIPDDGVLIQVSVAAPDEGPDQRTVTIHSRVPGAAPDSPWQLHAEGTLSPAPASEVGTAMPTEWPPSDATPIALDGAYDQLAEMGYGYGPVFQGLQAAWRRGEEVFAEVGLPEREIEAAQAAAYGLHPALLDAALHAVLIDASTRDEGGAMLPFAWTGVRLYATGAATLRVRLTSNGTGALAIQATDSLGRPVLAVEALVSRPVAADQLGRGAAAESLYGVEWVATPDVQPSTAVVPMHIVPAAADPEIPAALRTSLTEALTAIQDWLAREPDDSVLAVVTRNAVEAGGGGPLDLTQAPVAGLVRAAQAENPGRFVLVDVGPDLDDVGVELAVAKAVATDEPEVAVRGGQLWVRRLVRLATAGTSNPSPDEKRDGTVLITGGTGGLGAVIARHLVTTRRARRLVLTSRRGLDAPGAADLVADLAELGAEVEVRTCDVSDRDAVAALVSSIPDEHALTGVVHAAGVLDDGLLGAMDAGRLDRVLAPKADAAWHLHELTAGKDLDLFVLFSSAAGVFGGAGQANYAAANVFLDTLAHHRRAQGLPATSMAWGLWDSVGPAGMGGRLAEADVARLRRSGVRPLSVEEGLELFDAALASGAALAVPTGLDLGAASAAEVPPLLSGLVRRRATRGSSSVGGDWTRRLAGLDAAGRLAVLLDLVRAQAAATLGHASASAVDSDAAFKDLGFDSLSAVEFRNGLSAALGVRLPATLVFDYPNPLALAEHLTGQLSEGQDADEQSAEEQVRSILRSIPMKRIRDAGLLEALLELGGAGSAAAAIALSMESPDNDESIDEMDAASLIAKALAGSDLDTVTQGA